MASQALFTDPRIYRDMIIGNLPKHKQVRYLLIQETANARFVYGDDLVYDVVFATDAKSVYGQRSSVHLIAQKLPTESQTDDRWHHLMEVIGGPYNNSALGLFRMLWDAVSKVAQKLKRDFPGILR
jgi:hypothetical protein